MRKKLYFIIMHVGILTLSMPLKSAAELAISPVDQELIDCALKWDAPGVQSVLDRRGNPNVWSPGSPGSPENFYRSGYLLGKICSNLPAVGSWGRMHEDVVQALIRGKADPNTTIDQQTPVLVEIAKLARSDLVESLIKANAEVNAVDKSPFGENPTPLLALIANTHLTPHPRLKGPPGVPLAKRKTAQLLIAAKADINARTSSGKTALIIELEHRNRAGAEFLMKEFGADINKQFPAEEVKMQINRNSGLYDVDSYELAFALGCSPLFFPRRIFFRLPNGPLSWRLAEEVERSITNKIKHDELQTRAVHRILNGKQQRVKVSKKLANQIRGHKDIRMKVAHFLMPYPIEHLKHFDGLADGLNNLQDRKE